MVRGEGREAGQEHPPQALDALARLSAVLACGAADDWRDALAAANGVATSWEIEEVLLQSYLFVGFPVVLNALILWRDEAGATPPRSHEPSLEERCRDGEALCRRVYGKAYERLRDHVVRLHPDLDRWMVEEGYGKTLSRPGLTAAVRELCVVALLAAGGHERQLRAHLQGAGNVGASPGQIERALWVGLDARREGRPGDEAGIDRLAAVWNDLRSRVGT